MNTTDSLHNTLDKQKKEHMELAISKILQTNYQETNQKVTITTTTKNPGLDKESKPKLKNKTKTKEWGAEEMA